MKMLLLKCKQLFVHSQTKSHNKRVVLTLWVFKAYRSHVQSDTRQKGDVFGRLRERGRERECSQKRKLKPTTFSTQLNVEMTEEGIGSD